MILWETLELERQTLPENDTWSRLFILLLGDAALHEWRQWSQDGAAEPSWVGPTGMGNDLRRATRGCEGCHLSFQPTGEARVHGVAAWQDNVAEEMGSSFLK